VEAQFPELLAPLARAIHHGKCPACGSPVHGVSDRGPDGRARVQISCFGQATHVFFFDSETGRVGDQPTAFGTLKTDAAGPAGTSGGAAGATGGGADTANHR